MKNKIENTIKLAGKVNFTLAKSNLELEEKIKQAEKNKEDISSFLKELNKNPVYQIEQKNIVALSFHSLIADYIANVSPDNDILINYGALGTGTTTPNTTDVALTTEVYRKQISSLSSASSVVYVTVFYSSTEVDGTFYEHAFFSDASATTDSGILVNHVLIDSPTGIEKSNTETLTVDYTLIIQ